MYGPATLWLLKNSGGRYIYSPTVVKYSYEVLVLYLSIQFYCFIFLLHLTGIVTASCFEDKDFTYKTFPQLVCVLVFL